MSGRVIVVPSFEDDGTGTPVGSRGTSSQRTQDAIVRSIALLLDVCLSLVNSGLLPLLPPFPWFAFFIASS